MKHNIFAHRVVDLCRAVFGVISVCFIIGSLCVLAFWLLSSDYYYQIKPFKTEPIIVSQEGSVFETSLILVGSGQASFQRWIEDKEGNVVHQYPEYKISSSSEHRVTQGITYIPPLKPGTYIIKGVLFYKANPIRVSRADIIMGSFIVTN